MGEQPPKKDNNDPVDPDTLADEFDEKAALHSSETMGGNQDQELDEKAALHQEHQDELDALLSDSSPPTSRYIAHMF